METTAIYREIRVTPELLSKLQSERLWYVATPYSRWPNGQGDAFKQASLVMADLLRNGVAAVSPIVHSHPIAIHGGIDKMDHEFWMRSDKPLMDAASALLVVMMSGWEESRGIKEEIEIFSAAGKPVEYLPWAS